MTCKFIDTCSEKGSKYCIECCSKDVLTQENKANSIADKIFEDTPKEQIELLRQSFRGKQT